MNRRFFIMLSIALLLASLAAIVANRWIQNRTLPAQTVPVVVAAVEIPFGVKIVESQLKLIAWPEKTAPQGSFSSKEQVVNHIALNKFYPDEIITNKRTSEYLGGSTLSAMITKQFRAMSVRVDDVVGVSGFILPGNKVDVIATKKDRQLNEATSKVILQNIKVLAVDQEASQEKEKPAVVRAVTLELHPWQSVLVTQAMQEGSIQLSLRNPLDNDTVEIAEAEKDIPPPPIVIASPPSAPVVRHVEKKRSITLTAPW